VPTRGPARTSIHVHHAPAIEDEDRVVRTGILVTALPRTLLDLAQVAPRRLPRAIERSEQIGVFDLSEVDRLLKRCARHSGCRRLARAIAEYRSLDSRALGWSVDS
jgi:hypothetical protein